MKAICRLKRLVGVGHCFAWQDTCPQRIFWHVACIYIDQLTYVKVKHTCQRYLYVYIYILKSCYTYNISAQLAKAFNEPNKPFGGVNVVFSGDFSQLPPVGGGESISLYNGSIGSQIYSGLSHYGHESAIGKALWHQVTTVVILGENMTKKTVFRRYKVSQSS
jgi:hypothetical protein